MSKFETHVHTVFLNFIFRKDKKFFPFFTNAFQFFFPSTNADFLIWVDLKDIIENEGENIYVHISEPSKNAEVKKGKITLKQFIDIGVVSKHFSLNDFTSGTNTGWTVSGTKSVNEFFEEHLN